LPLHYFFGVATFNMRYIVTTEKHWSVSYARNKYHCIVLLAMCSNRMLIMHLIHGHFINVAHKTLYVCIVGFNVPLDTV